MTNSLQKKVFDLVTVAIEDAMDSVGEKWTELSFCNGAEVFESDSNADQHQEQKAA